MEAALRAIAEPTRRRILELVRTDERAAGEIAAEFDVTHAAISQHLKVLKEAGLVSERREGRRRLYRVERAPLDEVRTYFAAFWDQRLERLRQEVESDERRRDA